MDKLISAWAEITNVDVGRVKPGVQLTPQSTLDPADMHNWKLRECDREDTADWMPIDVIHRGESRLNTYYVNVNPENEYHSAILVMSVNTITQIDIWLDDMIIHRQTAVVEREPVASKPTKAEIQTLREKLMR